MKEVVQHFTIDRGDILAGVNTALLSTLDRLRAEIDINLEFELDDI